MHRLVLHSHTSIFQAFVPIPNNKNNSSLILKDLKILLLISNSLFYSDSNSFISVSIISITILFMYLNLATQIRKENSINLSEMVIIHLY